MEFNDEVGLTKPLWAAKGLCSLLLCIAGVQAESSLYRRASVAFALAIPEMEEARQEFESA